MSSTNSKLVAIGKTDQMVGFANGLRFPSLVARVSVAISPSRKTAELARFSDQLRDLFQSLELELDEERGSVNDNIEGFFFHWMLQICQAANAPVYQKGVLIDRKGKEYLLAFPFFGESFHATAGLLTWLVDTLNSAMLGKDTKGQMGKFSTVFNRLKLCAPSGFNTPRFLRAAYEEGIPASVVAGGVIQYGQGARARWMESSFTDRSSAVSAFLTRNKHFTSIVLHQAGLPVASHALCSSAEDAVLVANKLGYPVVIKPADKDGGLAVAAGLTNDAEVRAAFTVAESHSNRVMIEKHILGRDYRLNVFNNELLWAIERIPAGVTGDGKSTIEQLVNQENTDPRRAQGKHSALKMLVLDEDALTVLENRGQEPGDVPGKGEFVALRRNANISTGGTPVAVMDKVHPDNRSLAIRAAAALQLDLAGIDIICQDISRSWKETGAAICEVNGQPQLGGVTSSHVYSQILESLLEGNGRIPVVVVLGADPDSGLASELHSHLQANKVNAGLADQSGITINNERIVDGNSSFYAAGQMLLRDRTVQAAIINLNNSGAIKTGLPFAHIDILVIAGRSINVSSDIPSELHNRTRKSIFSMLLSACTGKVIVPTSVEKNMGSLDQWTTAEWVSTDSNQDQLIQLVAREIIPSA